MDWSTPLTWSLLPPWSRCLFVASLTLLMIAILLKRET